MGFMAASAASAAPVTLPDAADFKSWELPVTFARTYHVAQDPNASDNNAGTAEKPFRTIQRAADALQPGERVLIHDGVYRECVRPPRGGTGPDTLISYEAAPGAHPVITGTELFHGMWRPAADWPQSGANHVTVWTTRLPPVLFSGANPFSQMRLDATALRHLLDKSEKLERLPPAKTLSRGMIFDGDRRWTQVESFAAVETAPAGGVFWVEDGGLQLYARAVGDVNPNDVTVEVTTRSACFAPTERNLGYLRVSGLTLQRAGDYNGLIEENAGHHWLITSNHVSSANGMGIRLGRNTWADKAPAELGEDIVRANTITDCGRNGLGGMGRSGTRFGVLIEDNVLRSNCWQDIEWMYDSAAIKLLMTGGTVIRRNLIIDTLHGPAIWLDWQNRDSRCSSNTIVNTTCQVGGAIFLEANVTPNLVDHNVIWNTHGTGIYEHDCNDQIIVSNFVGRSAGPGIYLHGKITNRVVGKVPVKGGSHRVTDNILFANGEPIKALGPNNTITNTITTGVTATVDPKTRWLTWQVDGHPSTSIDLRTWADGY